MKTYHSSENKEYYFPPLLSNGNIAFAPDAEGMLGYAIADYKEKNVTAFDGIVVRTSRRSAMCRTLNAKLFPFGKFTFAEGSPLKEWSQGLETEGGFFESSCSYEDGAEIHSRGFIHPERNIYALQKRFEKIGAEGSGHFYYDVKMEGYSKEIGEYMQVLYTTRKGNVGCIGFKIYGMSVFTGEIHVFVDKAFEMLPIENGVRISFEASAGETVSFYYTVEDNLEGADVEAVLTENKRRIDDCGFDGLFEECRRHYREFFELGYVKTEDERLNNIYKTSLYGVKCNTTAYSVAVGLNNGTWDGRYFAFDEYTSFLGLLGANRKQLAKRVPSYRLHNCLDSAIRRASDCHRTEKTENMAKFHWESGEKDIFELAPNGSFQEHIFHIPLVGIGAYNYYEYTLDKEFLQKCYKMIRACAKFITKQMLYKDGDVYYIGKCMDLERLGAAVKNPFMTSCGTIKLLECCAKAAEVLEIDEEYAAECRHVAAELYKSLPVEEGRYTPFLHCEQRSIAVFAAKFPFDVLADRDEKMLAAWEDFEENGAAYGNMYPYGCGISPWYACWKAIAYARSKMTEKAYRSLKQAYTSVGVFDEMFEINEPLHHVRPWFSTAAGVFLVTVNEMLLQSDGTTIKILPAMPHDMDVSFKLAAKGGVTVEAEVKDSVLKQVKVMRGGEDVTANFHIEF